MNRPAQPAPEGALSSILPIDRQLAHDLVRPFIDMQGMNALEAAEVACQRIANWRVGLQDNADLRARCERLEGELAKYRPMPALLLECRDALPAITEVAARLHGIDLRLADRIETVLSPWEVKDDTALAQPEDGR